ncbi:hypothetical protein T265_02482 [Opisthorchis viverrini]|uniref:SCP domain-containing protein n=1 Tax=Opisthorchis viverrini TaxID=6198 RepID=A0A074ZW14_OPIVI|nr:hypothetical protein T265_02482 [Opisthorchis viverrini]KER31301.1 hypothetical protein T265_02482 [Opisthorchis viverrini]
MIQPTTRFLWSLLLCGLLSAPCIALSGDWQSEMVRLHNEARDKILSCSVPGQPPAKSMPHLVWHDGLAQKAQQLADQCRVGHDTAEERKVPDFDYVGQNWAGAQDIETGNFVGAKPYEEGSSADCKPAGGTDSSKPPGESDQGEELPTEGGQGAELPGESDQGGAPPDDQNEVPPPQDTEPPIETLPPQGSRPPHGSRPPQGSRPPHGSRPPYGSRPPQGSRPPFGWGPPQGGQLTYKTRPPRPLIPSRKQRPSPGNNQYWQNRRPPMGFGRSGVNEVVA